MADDTAQVETTTETQVAEPEVIVTEDVQKPTEGTEKEGSDFKQAMYEERRKRQTLEQRLNDPNYVYEQAKRLGLAAEEAEEAPVPASTAPAAVRQPAPNIQAQVQFEVEKQKVLDKYPELATSDKEAAMVMALTSQGLSLTQAADEVMSLVGKPKAAASAQKEVNASEKERAQTISGGTQVTEDTDELSQLKKLVRSGDPRVAKQAMQNLVKFRNKQAGIFS